VLTRRRLELLLHPWTRRNDLSWPSNFTDPSAPSLRQPPPVEHALGTVTTDQLCVVASLDQAVDVPERTVRGRDHMQAPILRSAPGIGPSLPPRVLAEERMSGRCPNPSVVTGVADAVPTPYG
jgi:hypothetical protein